MKILFLAIIYINVDLTSFLRNTVEIQSINSVDKFSNLMETSQYLCNDYKK